MKWLTIFTNPRLLILLHMTHIRKILFVSFSLDSLFYLFKEVYFIYSPHYDKINYAWHLTTLLYLQLNRNIFKAQFIFYIFVLRNKPHFFPRILYSVPCKTELTRNPFFSGKQTLLLSSSTRTTQKILCSLNLVYYLSYFNDNHLVSMITNNERGEKKS